MYTVQVSIEALPDRLFTYAVPEALQNRIRPGQRIKVPFGTRQVIGYVVAPPEDVQEEALPLFGGELDDGQKKYTLRAVSAIEEDEPFLSLELLDLARFLAEYYCVPLSIALRCVIPAPVREKGRKPKERFFVTPVEDLSEIKLTAKQRELYDNIKRVEGGWLSSLTHEFDCTVGMFHTLARYGAVTIEKKEQLRNPLARRKVLPTRPLALNAEQAEALTVINRQIDLGFTKRATQTEEMPQPVLLFGVTGSGKTEVYLQAIANVLEQGGGAIVMVPEIALTPQTVQRFTARFGSSVAVLHSALSDGERHDEWHRLRRGDARIVVGPRSAVFAPVQNLALIVVDEEHEPSYKQEEHPKYHARDIALMRGRLESCAVVLGTATPALETWANVTRGKYVLAELKERAAGRPLPFVRVVDMRQAVQATGHAQLFSEELIESMRVRLDRGEQTILFLNRRGFSASLQCPNCGYVETCEHCSISMTYHKVGVCLRCHLCGAWKHPPSVCPNCASPAFSYAGIGTQKIESVLGRILPQAKILRMDADVTARKNSHDEILQEFQSGRANILIGTQMIAKGHHFPNVTLVGVLAADMSLHQPDFRAAERTFQLLAQVAGRAGRGETPGEVLVQTYTPEHPAIQFAKQADFLGFAEGELAEREEWEFPPFVHLAVLTYAGASEEQVRVVAEKYETFIRGLNADGLFIAPASLAPLSKIKNIYRYQIVLRHKSARVLGEVFRMARREFPASKEVAAGIDIDALSLS